MFDTIDWTRPWLAPLRSLALPIIQANDWRKALNTAAAKIGLQNHSGLPIQFVPQEDLPTGTAYEAFISDTGCVPTRDNLHDFFNALVWLSFPRIKVQLNAVQATELAKANAESNKPSRSNNSRGKVRDAATIFDENAALLVVRDTTLLDALREHYWKEVFVERRAAFERDYEVRLFGHALIEKLVTPYKAITGHAWPVVVTEDFFAMSELEKCRWIDDTVSQQLVQGIANIQFTPLPVLGVPSWWEQQDDLFYQDNTVFRPKKNALS